MNKYHVSVGNIGNIDCDNKDEAYKTYKDYVEQSKSVIGRASQEPVFLICDGEVIEEHEPVASDKDLRELIDAGLDCMYDYIDGGLTDTTIDRPMLESHEKEIKKVLMDMLRGDTLC